MRAGLTQVDLLTRVTNDANLAHTVKRISIPVSELDSNYYSLVLVATDANGFQVKGVSYPVGVQGRGVSASWSLIFHLTLLEWQTFTN